MTTQGTADSEANVTRARKPSTERRSAREAIQAGTSEAKAALSQVVETGKTLVTEYTGGVRDGIRGKPMQCVLVAAAVGAFIGLIVARRR